MLRGFERTEESECELCGKESKKISDPLPLCLECIREKPERALEIASQIHSSARRKIGLPPEIPENSEGVECPHCANSCRIPEGDSGYCNLSKNKKGQLTRDFGTPERAVGSWYRDSHPTNCVASWCCAGRERVGASRVRKDSRRGQGLQKRGGFSGHVLLPLPLLPELKVAGNGQFEETGARTGRAR